MNPVRNQTKPQTVISPANVGLISNGVKILMPAMHYWPVIGGIETWTKEIAERLSQEAEIFVVTGRVKAQPKKEIKNGVKIFRASLFPLTNLSHSPLIYTLSLLPFIFLRSLVIIKKEKINLLHCQGFLSSLLGFLLSKICRIPYVVTVQRLETKNWLKKKVYRNAACCIAASSAVKRYFQDIGCQNIEVIPNGIDLERFRDLDRRKHEFVVMTVARLEKVKGIEYLIKAAHILNSSSQLPASRFVIIGEGKEKKNLERLVKELRLQGKVKFLGQVPNEEIPRYLAAASCFVLPSLKEGFGIVILEAMAAGVPVIAANVGGIPDIIEQGRTGILVEPKNPSRLAEAIIKIYSQPEFAENLTENAELHLHKYNWSDIAQRVSNLYGQILA